MTNPVVSIVICCHNRAKFLPVTIESALNQCYRPVEIVVLDDGSTDDTQELMKNYGDKIRYYWQKNCGVAAARTAACKLAQGDYIAFLDDDDLMTEDRICRLYDALRLHPSAVVAFGDWANIDKDGNLTGERSRFKISVENDKPTLIKDGYRTVLWTEALVLPHTSLFRKDHGERIGWFDTRFYACEDADFFARCGQLGPFVYVPRIVSHYRKGHESLCSRSDLELFSRSLLYSKHLMEMKAKQNDFSNRLRLNLFHTLRKLAVYQRKGEKLSSKGNEGYAVEALSLLGLKLRLRYEWFIRIKLPLRRIILRYPNLKKYGKEKPLLIILRLSEIFKFKNE